MAVRAPMITTGEPPGCAICGLQEWIPLPPIGPCSMASDWRVLDAPLRKCACARCGVIRGCGAAGRSELFVRGYSLYAHAPDDPLERSRQEQYGAWIANAIEGRHPRSVLDVGCGNGSLLLALRRRWPDAALMGCDLSTDSVAHGREAGLELRAGAAADLPADVTAELVLTVNVVEHASDPLEFLRTLRVRVSQGGVAIVVCPNGALADVDLLIADHVHSFAPEHLEMLLVRAGFGCRAWARAPDELGAFQLAVAEPAGAAHVAPTAAAASRALHTHAAYLQRWSELDRWLLERLTPGPVVCFGMGETTGLLRAYAPATWSRVRALTADRLADPNRFLPLPAIPLADVPANDTVVVGVRAQDQPRVAERLRQRFTRVVTWYDLAAAR